MSMVDLYPLFMKHGEGKGIEWLRIERAGVVYLVYLKEFLNDESGLLERIVFSSCAAGCPGELIDNRLNDIMKKLNIHLLPGAPAPSINTDAADKTFGKQACRRSCS